MKLTKYVQDLQVLTDKIKFVKPILRPLAKLYYSSLDKREKRRIEALKKAFLENGLKVLESFDQVMTANGYKYSLAFGTMLGAVREHGFISHDADIDVFMWIEDFDNRLIEILTQSGFILKHTFIVDDGKCAREDTIEKDGVQIDIFYIYPALEGRKYTYCCDFIPIDNCRSREQSLDKYGGLLPRRLEMPTSKELVRVPFERLSLPILKNAHEFLSFRYGKDYMTPKPNWTNGENPYIVRWVEKKAIFIEYKGCQ